VIKNLTPGLPTKYDSINLNFNPTAGISFAWNKDSNQIAFFVRKEFSNHLIVMDVLNNKILKNIKLYTEQVPSSPVFDPKNSNVLFYTGMEATQSFIYSINLDTKKVSKHTDGLLVIKAMDIAKNGERIVYSAQKDGYYKLFLGTMKKPELAKQLTFGNYNDITPAFSEDGKRIWYSSDERQSYNINSIDLENKTMKRFSDVKTGNFFPLEIPGEKDRVVMSSFYKGQFSLFKKDVSEAQEERQLEFEMVDSVALAKKEEELSSPDLEIKFKGKYKPLSKLYIKSLPPLSVSLGSDGGFFGYSYLSLTDLLGNHNFSMLISSYYGYRSYHLSYLNQSSRLQLYAHLFADKQVYYTNYTRTNYLTLRSNYGGEFGVFYPFSRSYRAEATASIYKQNENSDALSGVSLPFGQFYDGYALPLRFSLVGETTRFSNFGPLMGHTFKLSFSKYISFSDKFLDAYTIDVDMRKYVNLGGSSLLAFRFYGFKSGGENALLFWTGGNNTFRTAGFRRLVGNNIALFNAEFRFPLIHVALTPLGLVGPVRGVMFFDVGGVWFNGQDFNVFSKDDEGKTEFRLEDALSAYGFGVEFFLFGYPMHVEWVWRTDWKQKSYQGVNFWIGFDF
jgi:Tol biopolymer transport system component